MDHRHTAHGCCDSGAHKAAVHSCCGFSRRFPSRDERKQALEQYRDQLKHELTGVEERLEELS